MEASEVILCGYYDSPIGMMEVRGTEHYILSVKFVDKGKDIRSVPLVIQKCIRQLNEYFEGVRRDFAIELQPEGSDFQKRVWQELQAIKFGRSLSYIELSKKLRQPLAVRAVGNANSKNPVSIIIPCHRVIGSNGSLIGYAGGLQRKQWLLDHEKKIAGNYQLNLFEQVLFP